MQSRGIERGDDRDHLARLFPRPAAARRSVGVEGLDFVADPRRLAQGLGAADHADPHFRRVRCSFDAAGQTDSIDADQFEARLAGSNADEPQPLAHDLERQPSARERARSGVGNLPFADATVDITNGHLQRVGPLASRPRRHRDPVRAATR